MKFWPENIDNKSGRMPMFRKLALMTGIAYGNLRLTSSLIHIHSLIKHKHQRENPVSLGVVTVTKFCPVRCKNCLIPIEMREDPTIRPDIPATVSNLINKGSNFIVFTGGEPLDERTAPIIRTIAAAHPLTTFVVGTNGCYIATHGLGELTKTSNIFYFVSIDGMKRTNDQLRQPGGFDIAIQAMHKIRHAGFYLGSSTRVCPENIDEVTQRDFIKFLSAQGTMVSGFVLLRIPNHAANSPEDSLPLDVFHQRLDALRQKTRDIPIIIFNRQGPFFNYQNNIAYTRSDGRLQADRLNPSSIVGHLKIDP